MQKLERRTEAQASNPGATLVRTEALAHPAEKKRTRGARPRQPKQVAFADMRAADRRRTVARDVIAQLDAGCFKATSGTYFDFPMKFLDGKLSRAVVAGCEVCAVGACLVATLLRKDPATTLTDYDMNCFGLRGSRERARGTFTLRQLDLMEEAFELQGDGRARKFGECHLDDEERLRAIMLNVIEHGEFRP